MSSREPLEEYASLALKNTTEKGRGHIGTGKQRELLCGDANLQAAL